MVSLRGDRSHCNTVQNNVLKPRPRWAVNEKGYTLKLYMYVCVEWHFGVM